MTIKLYIDYSSQPSRAVLAFCRLNKIPVQIIETRVFKGETRSQSYRKINPMKKVPAIEDTDEKLSLAESHAIMRYLAAKFKTEEKWYPQKDIIRQAKVNEYLDFHHTNTRKCSFLIFNTLFAPKIGIKDPSFVSEYATKQVKLILKLIEETYLANSSYIVGEEPSIADLSAFYQIQFLILLNFDFSKYPKIEKWMKYMKGIKEVSEVNKKFYEFVPKLQQLARAKL